EGRRQIVAAALDQDDVELRETPVEVSDGGKVQRGILANGGMRTAASLDADDAIFRNRLGPGKDQGILTRIDVIGNDCHRISVAHGLEQLLAQGRLARADRAANADPQGAVVRFSRHERKILVSSVSWAIAAISAAMPMEPRSAAVDADRSCASLAICGSREARIARPSDCPSGDSLTATEICA